jgi:hypothetical protein
MKVANLFSFVALFVLAPTYVSLATSTIFLPVVLIVRSIVLSDGLTKISKSSLSSWSFNTRKVVTVRSLIQLLMINSEIFDIVSSLQLAEGKHTTFCTFHFPPLIVLESIQTDYKPHWMGRGRFKDSFLKVPKDANETVISKAYRKRSIELQCVPSLLLSYTMGLTLTLKR